MVAQYFSAGKTGDPRRFSVPTGRLKPHFAARCLRVSRAVHGPWPPQAVLGPAFTPGSG